jgi:hypothetical protein
MPARKSSEPKLRRTQSKFLSLPADFNPVDATREEVSAFRRESLTTVNQKCKDGRYESYLDGRLKRIDRPVDGRRKPAPSVRGDKPVPCPRSRHAKQPCIVRALRRMRPPPLSLPAPATVLL